METKNFKLRSIDRLYDLLEDFGTFRADPSFRKGEIAEKITDIIIEVHECITSPILRSINETKIRESEIQG